MRIDFYNSAASQLSGEPTARQVNSGDAPSAESTASEDRTTFSSGPSSLPALVGSAMSTPEIRQDKVASLQQAISSGSYKLDPEAIAGAMIDEHA